MTAPIFLDSRRFRPNSLTTVGVWQAETALAQVAYRSKADLTAPKSDFRFTPENGLYSDIGPCPFRADFVVKVG